MACVCKEEQVNEIDALQSIYSEELEILCDDPFHIFEIKLAAESDGINFDAFNRINVECTLEFEYVENYPEVPLVIEVSSSNLSDADCNLLVSHLKDLAEENVGMVMVFTLVSAAEEKLAEFANNLKEAAEQAIERQEREAEEAEKKKFHGTPVTVETFMAWKEKYDAEMAELRKQKGLSAETQRSKKPTGREMFICDRTLDDSDIRLLQEEGGETVEIDETLFQDLGDLDLDDDVAFDEDIDSVDDAPIDTSSKKTASTTVTANR